MYSPPMFHAAHVEKSLPTAGLSGTDEKVKTCDDSVVVGPL